MVRVVWFVLGTLILVSLGGNADAQSRVHGIVVADLSRMVEPDPSPRLDVGTIFSRGPIRVEDLLNFSEHLELTKPQPTTPPAVERRVPPPPKTTPTLTRYMRSSILLPDIDLMLLDAQSGDVAAQTRSNVYGVFDLPEVSEGRYRLCWRGEGWEAACAKDFVSAENGPVYVLPVEVAPARRRGYRALAGQVLMEDGSPCRFVDLPARIDVTAHVRSVTTPSQNVRANAEGWYVLPFVGGGAQHLLVRCSGSDFQTVADALKQAVERGGSGPVFFDVPTAQAVLTGASADAVAVAPSGGDRRLDFSIDNRRPIAIDLMFETRFGRAARGPAGEVVEVVADVRDDERLALFWTVSDGDGSASGSSLKWRVPDRPGQYVVTLLAGDGRGGWRRMSKSFEVTQDAKLPFGGVITLGGHAIALGKPAGLEVSVNGNPIPVSAEGYFWGKIDPADDDRYVLNIDAEGAVPLSRVFHRESVGGSYDLKPAQTVTFHSEEDTLLRFGLDRNLSYVRFEPGSLVVEETGQPVNGPVVAEIAYLDPAEGELPGDFDGVGINGADQALISFGAVYVGLRDGTGAEVQLAPGMAADLSVAVAPNSYGSPSMLPPTTPVWTYDTKTGFWIEEPTPAVLAGGAYRTKMSHFSTVNMDLGVIGNAACVRVVLDFVRTPTARKLVVSTPNGLGGTQTKSVTLDKRLNAVFRLLPLSTVTFEMRHADGAPFQDFQLREGDLTPIAGNQITLQPGDEMQSQVDLWPNEPFLDCPRLVVASSDIDQPQAFFTRKEADSLLLGRRPEAYYAFMDPNGDRETLEEWLTHNGFQPTISGGGFTFAPGANVVELSYLNHGDLGSGRKMHCRKDDDRVACVVGNYSADADGNFNRNPASADVAGAAVSGSGFATVAMEHSALEGFEGEGRFVKFFTYGEANNRARIIAAALDEAGSVRNHPEVCQICHGGSIPFNFPADEAAAQNLLANDPTGVVNLIDHFRTIDPSSFREFDLEAFRNLQGSQPESKVKLLNCDYVLDSEPHGAIEDLIIAWYGDDAPGSAVDCDGFATGGEAQTAQEAPPEWQELASDLVIYNDVVARVCRTCHIAQKNYDFADPNVPSGPAGFSWNAANGTQPYTCNLALAMPNAPIPFSAYWIDRHHDDMIATYGACP